MHPSNLTDLHGDQLLIPHPTWFVRDIRPLTYCPRSFCHGEINFNMPEDWTNPWNTKLILSLLILTFEHFEGWERKRSKNFFPSIHLDLFPSHSLFWILVNTLHLMMYLLRVESEKGLSASLLIYAFSPHPLMYFHWCYLSLFF